MPDDLPQLAKQYHAFYEVSPYYIELEERRGDRVVKTQRIQAGFDVNVYGVSSKGKLELPPPEEFSLAYAALKKIADNVSQHNGDCFIDVMESPSIYVDARHFQAEAKIRIRISHRDLDQPAGPAEQHALEEIEKQLQGAGIARR